MSLHLQKTHFIYSGREGFIENSCARGLEYGPRLKAEGPTQDKGHACFFPYGPTKIGKCPQGVVYFKAVVSLEVLPLDSKIHFHCIHSRLNPFSSLYLYIFLTYLSS